MIGATTLNEYRKNIEKDAPWSDGSSRCRWVSPARMPSLEILKGLQEKYEKHHSLQISDEALRPPSSCLPGINDRFLPDKAIDLMEGCQPGADGDGGDLPRS